MTFSHKLKKALHLRTYTQSTPAKLLKTPQAAFIEWMARRAAARVRARKASLTIDNLLRNVDRAELQRIRAQYSEAGDRPDVFWTKYLDVEKWLALNIRYANEYQLIAHPPRDVLDLGCGGGYFLVVCRHLGARVVGIDLNKDLVLNEMIAAFHLKRVVWHIRAFVTLPKFRQKFDLITAFMICFNFPTNRPAWGVAEWDFFLNDLIGRLKTGGRVILGLNRDLVDGTLYDDTLKSYFEQRGAAIKGKRVVFAKDDLVRTRNARLETAPVKPAEPRESGRV